MALRIAALSVALDRLDPGLGFAVSSKDPSLILRHMEPPGGLDGTTRSTCSCVKSSSGDVDTAAPSARSSRCAMVRAGTSMARSRIFNLDLHSSRPYIHIENPTGRKMNQSFIPFMHASSHHLLPTRGLYVVASFPKMYPSLLM